MQLFVVAILMHSSGKGNIPKIDEVIDESFGKYDFLLWQTQNG